ncbi:Neuropeptide CCHamide-1 receptor [Holothuria leucospilota]|uniref:Neuropeptide CCHamide-1 receptor n=1 Tax=Holothuria leucospilota TaxID=206669 RepID=A0A9Q1BLV2_HOLLE|nr:Neuropeptide CCHamide-1 receptor [Holothuria leucospilota]
MSSPQYSSFDYMSFPNLSYNGTCDDPDDNLNDITPFIISVLFIIGVLGNGSLICISIMHKDMRTPPNLLIINMSLGDLLLLIFTVPDVLAFYIVGGWIVPLFFCKTMKAVQNVSQGVSVFTFAALSYDRYEAISRPFSRRHTGWRQSGMRTLAIAATIWFISFLFSLPAMVMAYVANCGHCSLPFNENEMKIYQLVMFLAVYLIPFLAVFVFYTLTALVLIRDTGAIRGSMRGAADRRQSSRNRLAFVILLAAVLFFVLWLPYYVAALVFEFMSEFKINKFFSSYPIMYVLLDFTYLFPLLSSCTNPLLLYAVSSNYRRKLKAIFSGCPFFSKHQWNNAKTFTMTTLRTNSAGSNCNHRDFPANHEDLALSAQEQRRLMETQMYSVDRSKSSSNHI